MDLDLVAISPYLLVGKIFYEVIKNKTTQWMSDFDSYTMPSPGPGVTNRHCEQCSMCSL